MQLTSQPRNQDPLILLLHEFEILLTQIHLIELYVERAHATASADAERMRRQYQADVDSLRAVLQQKDVLLEEYQAQINSLQQNFSAEIETLRKQVDEKQAAIQSRSLELKQNESERAALRERIRQIESAAKQAEAASRSQVEQFREEFQSEVIKLRTAVEHQKRAVQARDATAAEFEQRLHSQIGDLRKQLAEKQALLENSDRELHAVRSEVVVLLEKISQIESVEKQAEATATESELREQALQTELATLRREIDQKETALRERQATTNVLEKNLSTQIDHLGSELTEKAARLARREDELRGVKAELASRLEQIAQMESARTQIAQAAALESQQIRESAAAEISALRSQLAEREQTLQIQKASVTGVEQSLNAEIHHLQNQLAEKQLLLENRERELEQQAASRVALHQRVAQLETATEEARLAAAAEAEKIHQQYQSELTSLRQELGQKEQALDEHEAAVKRLEQSLRPEVETLRFQLAEKDAALESSRAELDTSALERASLLNRVAELESTAKHATEIAASAAEEVRSGLQTELAKLREELKQKDLALQGRAAIINELQDRVDAERQNLQNQLAERNASIESKDHELRTVRTQVNGFLARIAELESTCKEATAAARQAEHARQAYENQLKTLRSEFADKEDLSREREAITQALQADLTAQIHDLRDQLAEKQVSVESLEAKLQETQSHRIALQEQITQLEAARKEAEKHGSVQAEQIRESFRSEMAVLVSQLRDKEQALAAHVLASESNENFKTKIIELEGLLKERQLLLDSRDVEISDFKIQICRLLEQNARLESAGSEADRNWQTLETELAGLQSELAQKERALQDRLSAFGKLEDTLTAHVQDFRSQLKEKQELLIARDEEIGHLKAQSETLLEQISQLEAYRKQLDVAGSAEAEMVRENAAAEISALQHRLEEKEKDLETQRKGVAELENRLNTTIHGLQSGIAEKQRLLESGKEEVQHLESERALLIERIAKLESGVKEASATATETERVRQELQTQIASLREELEHKQQALHETLAHFNGLEQNLRNQLRNLETRLAEKQRLLENRNRELANTTSEMDALLERITLLESRESTVEKTTTALERMSQKHQAELATLRHELSEKERILDQYKAAVQREANPAAPTQDPEPQRGEPSRSAGNRDWDFLLGDPTLKTLQKEKFSKLQDLVETIKSDPEQPHNTARSGRWGSIGYWKRRWKT